MSTDAEAIRRVLANPDLITAAHVKIEDFLIEMRDSRVGLIGPANGFVVREFDSTPSDVIRLGTRDGITMALKAIAEALEQEADGA
jgi:hypothetical protein